MPRPSSESPILVYDRLDANRRKSRWLLVALGVASAPVLLFAANYLASIIAMFTMMYFMNAASSFEAAFVPIIGISTAIAVLLV